jgi:hypothetical protein
LELKKLAGLLVGSLIIGFASANPAVAVHDSGANGNTIIMSDYGNPATTYSATAVSHNVAFDCFNSLPETRLTFRVGGLGSGVANSSGSTANRFVVTWTQASTSNTVTFSPRFVAKETPSATSTGSFTLTINYSTFSLQVAPADTIRISYEAPANGATDIMGTPDGGANTNFSVGAMSFSGLVFDASKFTGVQRMGSCFPGSGGGGGSTPDCLVNGSPATLAQGGLSRTTLSAGETYQITLGGQPLQAACKITINSGYWVRTSVNNTVVVTSGTNLTSAVTYTSQNILPISYETLLTGLQNQGYSTPIQPGDVWKREVFTTSVTPTSGDIPVVTMIMTLGVSGGGSSPSSVVSRTVYSGPQILVTITPRPILPGASLVFTGENLSAITSATIGAKTASLSFDAKTGLTIGTPDGLTPGKYDLVMQSSFGKLTHINAVTIKAPTPTATIGFRSDAQHLNEKQVLDLVAFNKTLNPDYEKVRCIVNAADEKTAKRIADLVCAHVARGEARNVEVIKDVRTSYPGEGFWVRVYAAG